MALKDLVKSTDKQEEILENILKERVDLVKTKDERSVKITKEFMKLLDNGSKILLYSAGKLAWSLIEKVEYWTKPREFEANLFITGGSIRPLIMRFRKEKFLEFNKKEKGYMITSLGILELENLFQKYEKRQKK